VNFDIVQGYCVLRACTDPTHPNLSPFPGYNVYAREGVPMIPVPVLEATIEPVCGVVSFTAPSPGVYYVYYLPYDTSGCCAGVTFSWVGCNDTSASESNPCVMRRRLLNSAPTNATQCDVATPSALTVTAIENRDAWNAFTDMEMRAAPSEAAASAAVLSAAGLPFGAFTESADYAVRDLLGPPARWALRSFPAPPLALAGSPGQFLAFQIGLWAYAEGIVNLTASTLMDS